jgi:hypothetical protein
MAAMQDPKARDFFFFSSVFVIYHIMLVLSTPARLRLMRCQANGKEKERAIDLRATGKWDLEALIATRVDDYQMAQMDQVNSLS